MDAIILWKKSFEACLSYIKHNASIFSKYESLYVRNNEDLFKDGKHLFYYL